MPGFTRDEAGKKEPGMWSLVWGSPCALVVRGRRGLKERYIESSRVGYGSEESGNMG